MTYSKAQAINLATEKFGRQHAAKHACKGAKYFSKKTMDKTHKKAIDAGLSEKKVKEGPHWVVYFQNIREGHTMLPTQSMIIVYDDGRVENLLVL